MKKLIFGLGLLGFFGGIAIAGSAIYTLILGGYVILPSRFRGEFNIYPSENFGTFAVLLLVYFGGGALFCWLGWKLIREGRA